MKYIKLIFIVSLLFGGCSLWKEISGQYKILPNQSVVLDSTLATDLVSQCSRYAPIIEGSWNPSPPQIQDLENKLYKISELTSEKCCLGGEKVDDINKFYRQYVGVIINGKKLIYINAFSKEDFEFGKSKTEIDWRKESYIICDGGYYYWGAIYNPENKEFTDLAFNGVA